MHVKDRTQTAAKNFSHVVCVECVHQTAPFFKDAKRSLQITLSVLLAIRFQVPGYRYRNYGREGLRKGVGEVCFIYMYKDDLASKNRIVSIFFV